MKQLHSRKYYYSYLNGICCEQTRSAILWSQNFDSIRWPTVLTMLTGEIKGKRAISRHACVDHYVLLIDYLSNHYAFYINKRFEMLFKDQFARSKATSPFLKQQGDFWKEIKHSHVVLTNRFLNSIQQAWCYNDIKMASWFRTEHLYNHWGNRPLHSTPSPSQTLETWKRCMLLSANDRPSLTSMFWACDVTFKGFIASAASPKHHDQACVYWQCQNQ